jgi:hypothetical protein
VAGVPAVVQGPAPRTARCDRGGMVST